MQAKREGTEACALRVHVHGRAHTNTHVLIGKEPVGHTQTCQLTSKHRKHHTNERKMREPAGGKERFYVFIETRGYMDVDIAQNSLDGPVKTCVFHGI